jgi:hypothetical protein
MEDNVKVKLKAGIKSVLNEEVKPTGFSWGEVVAVCFFLPLVVCGTLMLYTSTPIITGKHYLLFTPSIAVIIFSLIFKRKTWFRKDFKL